MKTFFILVQRNIPAVIFGSHDKEVLFNPRELCESCIQSGKKENKYLKSLELQLCVAFTFILAVVQLYRMLMK